MTTWILESLQILSLEITETLTCTGLPINYVTFERVSSRHLDDSKPIVSDIKDFDNINYLMSKDELEWQRNDYIILVARVLLEFFPSLGPLRDVVPSHILHR